MNRANIDADGFYIPDNGPHRLFHMREFKCRCGRCEYVDVDQTLINLLTALRMELAAPVVITSGIRCADHNARVGGAPTSWHVPEYHGNIGRAADIRVGDRRPASVYQVWRRMSLTGGTGLYRSWLHVDTRPERMEWVGSGTGNEIEVQEFIARCASQALA